MRKTLLVVALIGASFAGGAVVNGPGLAWVRNAVGLSTPGIEGDPFAESLDDLEDDVEPARPARSAPSTPRRTPARPVEPDAPEPEPVPEPKPKPAPAAPVETPAATTDPAGWGDAPGSAPSRAFIPPARDAEVARTEAPKANAAPPTLEPPAAAVAADQTPTLLEPTDEAARWADLADRMKTLGVRRFWVEGEPGGTVTFRCAVPLVGRSAVAQQFEAEGPDVCAAAESALKRAALWQATEAP